MNREALKGCGCALGLLGLLAALGVGGVVAVVSMVALVGWPGALAIVALLLAIAAGAVWMAARFIAAKLHAWRLSRPLRPYRAKLAEIDSLLADVLARVEKVAGEGDLSVDLRAKVREVASKKDAVIRALLDLDEFLAAPGNREGRLAFESASSRVRAHIRNAPELAENAEKLEGIARAVKRVRADRESLVHQLDRIAIGLREMRAKLFLPDATPAQVAAEIDDDLASVNAALERAAAAHREVAELDSKTVAGRVVPTNKVTT